VAHLEFNQILPGHGPLQANRQRMADLRNYIEELTEKVAEAKKAGKPVADIQKAITLNSLKSMRSDDYAEYLAMNHARFLPSIESAALVENALQTNIADIYKNLDRV
jgi:hypothetical protein